MQTKKLIANHVLIMIILTLSCSIYLKRKAKDKLEILEAERNNKLRLVQINTYYGERYAEHTDIMKVTVITVYHHMKIVQKEYHHDYVVENDKWKRKKHVVVPHERIGLFTRKQKKRMLVMIWMNLRQMSR